MNPIHDNMNKNIHGASKEFSINDLLPNRKKIVDKTTNSELFREQMNLIDVQIVPITE